MSSTFRHRKTGRLYDVLSEAVDCTNSRDGLVVVIYAPHRSTVPHYVRERSEFFGKFEPVATQETLPAHLREDAIVQAHGDAAAVNGKVTRESTMKGYAICFIPQAWAFGRWDKDGKKTLWALGPFRWVKYHKIAGTFGNQSRSTLPP